MLSNRSIPFLNNLFAKYLLITIPVFMLFTAICLSWIAERTANNSLGQLNSRIGSRSATLALRIDNHISAGNQLAAQDLLNVLMDDPAIECAELTPTATTAKSLKTPRGIGCTGQGHLDSIRIDIDRSTGSFLRVRYNTNEVEDVRMAQREFSLFAMIISLMMAVGASFLGFRYIVKRPLEKLLNAIQQSAASGQQVHAGEGPNDELGVVINAYNDMQTRLQQAHEELETRVDERAKELVKLQEKLLQRERLSAVGRLTAKVSHQLQNPFGSMRTSLYSISRLAKQANLDIERPLQRVYRSINRSESTLEGLLEYTQTKVPHLEAINAGEYLAEVLREVTLPGSIELKQSYAEPDPIIELDVKRFRRVIINLVENAAEAITGFRSGGGMIVVATYPYGAGVEISISDNGPGVSADVLEKMFEPLYTTKNHSAGLGLPTVKTLIESHNAELSIETEINSGTAFKILFPPSDTLDASVIIAASA